MTLRRTFVIAFAAVAAVVAAVVGLLSYDVTAGNLSTQIDQSLATAATTVQSGGTLPPLPTSDAPGPPARGDGGGRGPRGRALALVDGARRVAPDGTVTVLLGSPIAVGPADLALAARTDAGVSQYRDQTAGPVTYRLLTRSTGSGAVMAIRDLHETDDVLGDLAVEITGAGLAVLAVAAAAGWLLARRITRRLLHLTEAAEVVSATGRLDTPVRATGRDEVGRLGTAFDTMLADLARSRDDQQRLVQNAGHELRTPLTSLRTNLSVLRRAAELSAGSRERLLDDLDGETRELTSLVNELVELASDRRAAEQPGPVDLTDLGERVAERFRRRTGREITVEGSGAAVEGRPHALERAVSNLLDNALKFDADGAEPVLVRVRPDRVEVLDRGPGIDPADTPHVFERFYRATAARSLTGSGLGLAIVREVAQLHGGAEFAAGRPGGGAVVGFTLHDPVAGG
jgi:two-component system, OmpR family, sensor histidine kinase MprB